MNKNRVHKTLKVSKRKLSVSSPLLNSSLETTRATGPKLRRLTQT